MRKITLLLLLIITTTQAQLINESFEGATFPPTGWTRFRTGPGTTFQWTTTTGGSTGASSKIANAFLNTTGSGTREQWLVTQQITINASNSNMSFKARWSGSAVPSFAKLSVKISTASQTTPGDFTMIKDFTEGNTASTNVISTILSNFSLDLSAYIGQNVYIAFVYGGNQFDGNGIYVDDVKTGTLSLENFNNNWFNIYPNPTKNNLNINLTSNVSGNTKIEIFDLLGKMVFNTTLNETQLIQPITLPNLEKGIYCLKVINNNEIGIQQMIIE